VPTYAYCAAGVRLVTSRRDGGRAFGAETARDPINPAVIPNPPSIGLSYFIGLALGAREREGTLDKEPGTFAAGNSLLIFEAPTPKTGDNRSRLIFEAPTPKNGDDRSTKLMSSTPMGSTVREARISGNGSVPTAREARISGNGSVPAPALASSPSCC